MHWCLHLCGIVTASIVYLYACVRGCKRKRRLLKEGCQTGRQALYVVSIFTTSGCSCLKWVYHIWWPQKQLSQNTWFMLSSVQVNPSLGWKYQIPSMVVHKSQMCTSAQKARGMHQRSYCTLASLVCQSYNAEDCLWTLWQLQVKGPVWFLCVKCLCWGMKRREILYLLSWGSECTIAIFSSVTY